MIEVDVRQFAADIKSRARRLGFDLVGITSAERSKYEEYFRDWLASGQAGEMSYLASRFDERVDPSAYVPGVRSVICVGMNYHVPLDRVPESEAFHRGRVARYALGDDYHDLIKTRLHALADWIREIAPHAVTRACVDTAPV